MKRTEGTSKADSGVVQSYEIADDLSDIDIEELDEMDEDEDEAEEGEGNDESRPRKKART